MYNSFFNESVTCCYYYYIFYFSIVLPTHAWKYTYNILTSNISNTLSFIPQVISDESLDVQKMSTNRGNAAPLKKKRKRKERKERKRKKCLYSWKIF